VEAGELDKAATLFTQVLDRDPGHYEAALNLAVVEARQGRVNVAVTRLRRLLQSRLDPGLSHRARALLRELEKAS
jgi:thioredoxin-like negative regulator of GroEL